MFEVGDSVRNWMLTACFLSIAGLALASILPWKSVGHPKLSSLMRWVLIPVIFLVIIYEKTMPNRFDLRVDLLLLLPMYVTVLLATIVRWFLHRRSRRSRSIP